MGENVEKFDSVLKEGSILHKVQSNEGNELEVIQHRLSTQYGFDMFHTYNREI